MQQSDRVKEVRRIFEEFGFGNADLLEAWDGDRLDDLADALSEDEFQTLLDNLQEAEER